jgi:putative FmdB family regulatory protein
MATITMQYATGLKRRPSAAKSSSPPIDPPEPMPIYAFACDACGHHFDRLQKLSDANPTACPACGAEGKVQRRLTAPQFRLSGGGWYETDFKKDGDRKRNLAGEGGEGAKPAADKPSESKTGGDSKPAAPAKPAATAD